MSKGLKSENEERADKFLLHAREELTRLVDEPVTIGLEGEVEFCCGACQSLQRHTLLMTTSPASALIIRLEAKCKTCGMQPPNQMMRMQGAAQGKTEEESALIVMRSLMRIMEGKEE